MQTTMQTAPLNSEPVADAATALHALLHVAATYPVTGQAWVRVSGEDRVRWLNGMVTNSIQALENGSGCYNFLLSAQGHIEGDANIFNTGDALLMETAVGQREHILGWLDHYIIMDDVTLEPLDAMAGFGLAGPQAIEMLMASFPGVSLPAPLCLTQTEWEGAAVNIVALHAPLVPRFEIWSAPETLAAIKKTFRMAAPCGSEPLEWLRLLEGTPLYGTDIRNNTERHELPQETAIHGTQSRALHFAKGCYLGQEIVERIRSRGNVHRALSGFMLQGEAPAAGTALMAEGKEVGEITSAAQIPLAAETITLAMGYIRREAVERKLPLSCNGVAVNIVDLPYRNF